MAPKSGPKKSSRTRFFVVPAWAGAPSGRARPASGVLRVGSVPAAVGTVSPVAGPSAPAHGAEGRARPGGPPGRAERPRAAQLLLVGARLRLILVHHRSRRPRSIENGLCFAALTIGRETTGGACCHSLRRSCGPHFRPGWLRRRCRGRFDTPDHCKHRVSGPALVIGFVVYTFGRHQHHREPGRARGSGGPWARIAAFLSTHAGAG